MKKWLKFTFAGFFSFKAAQEGAKLRFANVLLHLLFHFVLLVMLLSSGYQMSFSYNLARADGFSDYINHVFANSESSYRVNFELSNGSVSSSKLINTFDNPDDSEYCVAPYNLVVDTRDSARTFDDFLFKATGSNGEEIAYLPKIKNDANYKFSFSYSGTALVVSAKQSFYRSYLEEITDPTMEAYDKNAKKSFDELERVKSELSHEEYENKIYMLFATFYYPDLKVLGASESIPTIQGYYFREIINNKNKNNYVLLFDNIFVVNFENSANQGVVYDGYFTRVNEHIITSSATSSEMAASNIYLLMKSAFNAGMIANAAVYFINILTLSPITLLLVVALTIIRFIVSRRKKTAYSFLGLTIVSTSYTLMSSLMSGLLGMIFAIFLSRSFSYSLTIYLFFGLLAGRIIADIIFHAFRKPEDKELIGDESAF